MIKAEDLFIGAWVSVGGKPVEVRMVSRKKIGYHRDEDKTRLVYAKLADVEPLMVEKVEFGLDEWVVNGVVKIKMDRVLLDFSILGVDTCVCNVFNERLMLDTTCVHKMQRVLKIISRL